MSQNRTTTLESDRPEVDRTSFPPGLHNTFLFSGFNALSYPLVLSSPMVLYAKTLGASATVLGIIVGMMPLLVIFQIPAANYIPRVGFKRFVYAGWGTRVLFIFAMALVPLTGGFLNPQSRLALMLMLLFCFNLSRGISSSAWLPWITMLIPPTLRGKYLARDAGVQNSACFLTLVIAAGCLAGDTHPWQFALLFAFSAVAGAISLSFLKRIPDAEMPSEARLDGTSAPYKGTKVPWLAMINYAPFKKLLVSLVGWSVAYGGMTAFTVAFLRSAAGLSEGRVLLMTSTAYLGGLSSLWFLGPRLDRLGSKPVLTFSFSACIVVIAGWIALSGDVVGVRLSIVVALQFAIGLLAALVQMSNTRLAMAIIPEMGRNHFFAIYSVMGNVTLGLAPIGWGLVIDAIGARSGVWLGLSWNRFSVFFAGAAVACAITLGLSRRLHEPEAASMDVLLREILIESPQRFLVRFWPRG